jgi:dienelactone hydrolase
MKRFICTFAIFIVRGRRPSVLGLGEGEAGPIPVPPGMGENQTRFARGAMLCHLSRGQRQDLRAVTCDGAGHGFMRAGEAPDANDANKMARDDAFQRWLSLMKKI